MMIAIISSYNPEQGPLLHAVLVVLSVHVLTYAFLWCSTHFMNTWIHRVSVRSASLHLFCFPTRMSTTSQKHRDFVGEPMGDKPVTALSGIGETLGKKLEEQGFDKVEKKDTLGGAELGFTANDKWILQCGSVFTSGCNICLPPVSLSQASVVLGQFLLLKKDTDMFTEWLKDASGANSRQAGSCAQCLKEWCDAFLWAPASSSPVAPLWSPLHQLLLSLSVSGGPQVDWTDDVTAWQVYVHL